MDTACTYVRTELAHKLALYALARAMHACVPGGRRRATFIIYQTPPHL